MSYATLIDYEAGHLQVVDENYWDEQGEAAPKAPLTAGKCQSHGCRGLAGYIGSSPELDFLARLNNGINELPVVGKGIVPESFGAVFPGRSVR